LNGFEFLQVHHPNLWSDIVDTIEQVDATQCRTKVSKEKTMLGRVLHSPSQMNELFVQEFRSRGWQEKRVNYWVTDDPKLIRKTLTLEPKQQKELILASGRPAYSSYNQTDFVKDRCAVEVQFGKYFSVAYDMFVKHLAFYVGDIIDVGIEIVPMKELHDEMSTGVPWYEGELYNLIREGRGNPPVPLVLVGVTA
jgi:hypothetical protein